MFDTETILMFLIFTDTNNDLPDSRKKLHRMSGKIHPGRLLKTLHVLLSPYGGIKSIAEVINTRDYLKFQFPVQYIQIS